jgi:hypothetical protein
MPTTGHFVLHAHVILQVTAGRHVLETRQDGLPFDVATQQTHIQVASPRFTMPPDQILSTWPPANAEGSFDDRLPQIVLKRRTLPWERNPAGGGPGPTPWLALVVIADGEGQLSSPTDVAACMTPGTPWPQPEDKDTDQGLYLAVTQTVVRRLFPRAADLSLLAHVREVDIHDTELAGGDDDGWLAVVMANRLPVYDHGRDLPVRYLACLVNLEGQLGQLPTTESTSESFRFERIQDWSVLGTLAAAGPDAFVTGSVSAAGQQLVSGVGLQAPPRAAAAGATLDSAGRSASPGAELDGAKALAKPAYATQWTTGTAAATQAVSAAARDPDARRVVRDAMGAGFRFPIDAYVVSEPVLRFPVLAHWSFTATKGLNFRTLMQNLDVGLLGTEPPAAAPLAPPDTRPAPQVVETGHIGLNQQTRRGDATRAWYRGPAVPFPVERDVLGRPVLAHSADQLRRTVPDGREDLSLAAAFEIGRLTALSQLSVVSALQRLRQQQFGAGRLQEILARAQQPPAATGPVAQPGKQLALGILGRLAKDPDGTLGPRRPLADPGRALDLPADLDALVAEGLGLDLARLKKQAEAIGVLGALTRSEVPVVAVSPTDLDVAAVTPTLRAALDASLGQVLDVARPATETTQPPTPPTPPTRPPLPPIRPPITPPIKRVARAGARRAPRLDPLDELIAHAMDDDNGDDDTDADDGNGTPPDDTPRNPA